jgi:hypothetical protein
LFEEAVKIIKNKESIYVKSLGVGLAPVGLASEKYDVSYPNEAYQRYQAFETGEGYAYSSNGTSSRVVPAQELYVFSNEPFEAEPFLMRC